MDRNLGLGYYMGLSRKQVVLSSRWAFSYGKYKFFRGWGTE